MTDQEIIGLLIEIDCSSEITVSSWEAGFLETVCFRDTKRYEGNLTDKQRRVAMQIIEKYEGRI